MRLSTRRIVWIAAVMVLLIEGHQALAQEYHLTEELPVQVVDSPEHVLTVRVGPITLPGHTHHRQHDFSIDIPIEGWFVKYEVQVQDAEDAAFAGKIVHHFTILDPMRQRLFCPRSEEHVFSAGSELQGWPSFQGIGYRVSKGQKLHLLLMLHNDSPSAFQNGSVRLLIAYRPLTADATLKNIYPVWFDIKRCGLSFYDLAPGQNSQSTTFLFPYAGALLAIGGHLHDYGVRLKLENVTRNEEIVLLEADRTTGGRFLSLPIASFIEKGGYRVSAGDVIRVTATYDNPTGRFLAEAAMGIVVTYFLPDIDEQFAGLKRFSIN